MATLTITHTAAAGTLLEGTRKGDGAWDVIKAAQARYAIRGWKYFPSIRAIGIGHSRDRAPMLGNIHATADVLRAAGFDVEIDVQAAPRAMEEAEADRAGRMDERADALHAKAERKTAESDARFAKADQLRDVVPFGQPILVGHHSEKRHRRDLERMHDNDRKGIEAMREAQLVESRAVSSEHHMDARNNPRRVYRRIKTLKADLARAEKSLAGYTTRHLDGQGQPVYVFEHGPAEGLRAEELQGRVADLTEKVRYWSEALEAARAAGADVPPETEAIKRGYWVKSWAGWTEVTRVNKVTVTVLDSYGEGRPTFPRKITLDDIQEIRETSPYTPEEA